MLIGLKWIQLFVDAKRTVEEEHQERQVVLLILVFNKVFFQPMFKISVFRAWTQLSKTLSTKLTIFMSWSVKKETKRKRSCANWARPKPNLNNGRPNLREMDSLPLMSWKRNVAAEATKSWRSKTRFRTLTTKSLPSKRPILVWWVCCVLKKTWIWTGLD